MASAVQNTNSYSSSNDYISQQPLYRTNPWANSDGNNAIKLYGIETNQARHNVAFTWAVVSGGAYMLFSPTTGATAATDYQKWTVVDESGNESYAVGFVASTATTPRQVNTSALNRDNDWKVYFSTSNSSGATKVDFSYEIDSAAVRGSSSAAISYTNIA